MKSYHRSTRMLVVASCLAAMLLAHTLPTRSVYAQASQREYQIKASFLYHFLQFVEWPDSAFSDHSNQIIVGVLGTDPFGSTLDNTLAGKTMKGKKIMIRRFASLEELEDCHILFVSSSEENRLTDILRSLRHVSVLTIGELARFTQQGGAIKFFEFKNKVRFEINLEAAKSARLKISSKLLRLARVV